MKKRIAIGFGLSLLLGLTYFCIFGFRTTRVESIQRLTSQNVHVGATPEAVIRFLGARDLEPSPLFRPEAMSMNGHHYSGQSIVVGVKRYSARGLIWKEAIYLVFVFDQNQKLVRYDVFPAYDSF